MIEYRGELYPTRIFRVDNPEFGEPQVIRISVMSLWENIMHGVNDLGSDEEIIDDEIYYYVDDEFIEYSADEICEKYLDIPMKFIEEIIEEYLDN
jgi:hypothetical protein